MSPRILWYSYDFANSFAGIVLIFYFPLILIERGGAELWIGITSSIATTVMLLLLPRIGHFADTTGKGRMVMFLSTVASVTILIVLSLLFTFGPLTKEVTLIALILYGLFYIGFESALTVYSGLLRTLDSSKELSATSGFGYAFGQMGNVFCLVITNICISAGVIFFGVTGKPLGLFIGGVLAMLATLPFLLSLPKQAPVLKRPTSFSYTKMLKIVFSDKRLLLFLVAMMLLYDTILTFQIYISSYMKIVFHFTDSLVLYGGITGLTFGIIGAASGGFLVKKVSSPTKVLLYSALVYMLCACLFSIASVSLLKIFALPACSGLAYGLVFSLGRAVYAEIIPIHSQHEYFGFFTVFERMAAVIGPLVWTGTFLLMADFGKVVQYRVSVFGLAVVAFCAFMLLTHFHVTYGLFRQNTP